MRVLGVAPTLFTQAAPAKPRNFVFRNHHGCGNAGLSEGDVTRRYSSCPTGRRFCLNDAPAQSNRLGCRAHAAPQGCRETLQADRTRLDHRIIEVMDVAVEIVMQPTNFVRQWKRLPVAFYLPS